MTESTLPQHGKVAAYLHVMAKELDQEERCVTLEPGHPWGRQGIDFDPSYEVTTTPLYAAPEDQSQGLDEGATFVFKELAERLGVQEWAIRDGSETWEGDVSATLAGILYTAGIMDPETDAVRDIAALLAMRNAGDQLSLMAQTSGGTAGPDPGLQGAVKAWERARAL